MNINYSEKKKPTNFVEFVQAFKDDINTYFVVVVIAS